MKQLEKPQIWAGIECTINRLESGYLDQLELSGHYYRPDDIDAIADLGVSAVRYPILWEKHQPQKHDEPDFTWVAARLERLREHKVHPIAGLVHHGSGPSFTNLLDPKFPEMLAVYAKKVATRFPWINSYTPVNEPLTTARFSGLYGFWFPHLKNDASFAQMLINQLKGTVLAMSEIRKINANALLVQTEDLGKTYSTPLLSYQATMENDRRFLTYDILCGRLDKSHVLWNHFIHLGITEESLNFFIDNPCPPDILGVNYYCTSERYLDENIHKYPTATHGGNTIHEYADVEAIRVKLDVPHGFDVLMKELWSRYSIPIAVTEAHLHCAREGQMKWFLEIYNSSCKLKENGMDIRAVTAWSVLGAFGWNKLLTSPEMEYERGTFDVSSGKRRATAMVLMIKALARTGTYSNPVLHGEGWWKKDSRFFGLDHFYGNIPTTSISCQPIVIIGKTGTLGQAFSRICSARSLHHVLLSRSEVDICNFSEITSIIEKYAPWAIINAAGYVRVDDAENDPKKCFQENMKGAENLAIACNQFGIQLMTFSSDLVFDGAKNAPYLESDSVCPLNNYGRSKSCAETAVLAAYSHSLVIRTSAFFGPWDKYNFFHSVISTIEKGLPFYASTDIISPTYIPHLVNVALDLLIDEEHGIWHLTNNDAISWFDLAVKIAERLGFDSNLICKNCTDFPAKRPSYSVLNSERGLLMPTLDTAMAEYFAATLIVA